MICRSLLIASVAAAVSFAGQAKADYIVTVTSLTPSSFAATPPAGSTVGTMFTFTTPSATQMGTDGFTSPFNVINVAEPTAVANSTGSTTLTEMISITGTTGISAGQTESFTLSGAFAIAPASATNTIPGAATTFTGSISNISGSGFLISTIAYAQPSIGSSNGSTNSGNISIQITPTTAVVPEPASIAMLGLGVAGVGLVAKRRRAV